MGNTGVRTQSSSIPTEFRGEKQLPDCLGCEKAKHPVHVLLPGYEGVEDKNVKQPIDLVLVGPVSKQDC